MIPDRRCDLIVIGAGMAGMAASLFAANRGIDTVQVGMAGEITFASGLLDLMAVHPTAEKKQWDEPWAAIEAVRADLPDHPYAKVTSASIRTAFSEMTAFLADEGLVYRGEETRNVSVITPAGTVKQTYRVPDTMWKGVEAFREKAPCLLVDFRGLKGFSARQIKENLKSKWFGLRAVTLEFPGTAGELFPESLGRRLAEPSVRTELARDIAANLRGEPVVGLPAVFGLHDLRSAMSDLEAQTGAGIFELPTMPPSVAGLRLRKAFESGLARRGVVTYARRVGGGHPASNELVFDVGEPETERRIHARGAILCTGRFFGKGLVADRERIREPLLNLPVRQPEERHRWHEIDFWHPGGHAVNRAGVETDADFRPLDAGGRPVFPTLFAAGSILAHQDWMRQKCGSGLAIASAYAAVQAFLKHRP